MELLAHLTLVFQLLQKLQECVEHPFTQGIFGKL